MRRKDKSRWSGLGVLLLAVVIGAGIVVCEKADMFSVTMEPYAYVFDNVAGGQTYMQRFLLRIDSSACEQLVVDDSVLTFFRPVDGELRFDRVSRLDATTTSTDKYRLMGRFEGIDERNGEGLIGFTFSVTADEYAATVDSNDSTIAAQMYFVPGDSGLQFDHIGTTVKIGRRPVMHQ